jgi:RNA polymerase sigma-70 factor (ECF subfamily)
VLKREKDLSGWAPSSLLYTIATNTCLNMIRDNKRKGIRLDDKWLDNMASAGDQQEQVLDQMVLDRIFEKEKDTTRLIAVLHYVDRMTLEETAHYVGMSVSGIRKRLARLKEVCRQDEVRNQGGKDEI